MKYFKYFFISIILFSSFFFFSKIARADEIEAQQTNYANYGISGTIQSFTAVNDTNITEIAIRFADSGEGCSITVCFEGLFDPNQELGNCDPAPQEATSEEQEFIFTIPSENASIESGEEYYFSIERDENCDEPKFYGSFIDRYAGGSWNGDTVDDLYFTVWSEGESAPGANTILDPIDDSFVPVGDYEFNGECIYNSAVNQFYVGWKDWGVPIGWYDTDCLDYEWSKIYTVVEGVNNIYLVDRDATTTSDYVHFFGYNATSSERYNLSILYPEDRENHFFKRQSGDDIDFTFAYELPFIELNTSTVLKIYKFLDESQKWEGSFNTLYNNSLEYFDSDDLQKFTLDGFEASTTALIYYSAGLFDDEDVLRYNLNFWVDGNGDSSTPDQSAPELQDYGFWGNVLRWLFVPRKSFLEDYVYDIPEKLATVVPFAYYYQVKGEFEDLSVTTSTDTQIGIQIDIDSASFSMPVIDTTLEPITDLADSIRPYLEYALWILLAFYILERVFDFHL